MKAFCITLPETEERNKKALEHYREIGLSVTPFIGVHAGNFGVLTSHKYNETDWTIGAARTGCWLSHYSLWSALDVMDGDHFLVLENDAQFPKDWKKRLGRAFADVPAHYDMLYIGACCCEKKPAEHIKGEVFKVEYPFCTHAYVIAKKCIPFVLRTLRKVWAPIDIQLTLEVHPKLKVFTVLPTIISQFDTELTP